MKTKTKILSCTTAAALICSILPFAVSAENENGKVRVVVENNTYKVADGAKWEGTLVDEWVELEPGSTAESIITEVMQENGYADPIESGTYGSYISSVNGITSGDGSELEGSAYPGWLVGYNDWYGNNGISTLGISDGDEIFISYSLDMGVDIGSDYNNTSTALKSLKIENAELSNAFSSDITDYTITLNEGVNSIRVTPTAENKYYRYRIYKNEYTPDKDNDYKRSQYIPVSDGDTVYIGIGNSNWQYLGDNVQETVYELKINTPAEQSSMGEGNTEPSGEQKDLTEINKIIEETTSDIKANEQLSVVGNEWEIFALARFGAIDDTVKNDYVKNLSEYLANTELRRATDIAKYTITLTSLGYDMEDFGGINYISALSDYNFCTNQGINGAVYTLLALDTKNYEIPASAEGAEQNTREGLIDFVLSKQLEDGGWAFFGNNYEPDMTGMVLQSLAPYYDKNENVTEAVDKALLLLSEKQNADGTYTSYGAPGCENSAQIICALCALGIDPDTDTRFVKSGGSALDGLCSFYLSGEGAFSHNLGGMANGMSTDQAFYALCAYNRLVNGRTSLYDMTDIKSSSDNENSENSEQSQDSEVSENGEQSQNSENSDKTTVIEQSGNDKGQSGVEQSSENISSSKNTSAVQTGDSGIIYYVFVVLAASAFIAVLVYKKPKSDR